VVGLDGTVTAPDDVPSRATPRRRRIVATSSPHRLRGAIALAALAAIATRSRAGLC
jgi:hypothetical protein